MGTLLLAAAMAVLMFFVDTASTLPVKSLSGRTINYGEPMHRSPSRSSGVPRRDVEDVDAIRGRWQAAGDTVTDASSLYAAVSTNYALHHSNSDTSTNNAIEIGGVDERPELPSRTPIRETEARADDDDDEDDDNEARVLLLLSSSPANDSATETSMETVELTDSIPVVTELDGNSSSVFGRSSASLISKIGILRELAVGKRKNRKAMRSSRG